MVRIWWLGAVDCAALFPRWRNILHFFIAQHARHHHFSHTIFGIYLKILHAGRQQQENIPAQQPPPYISF